VPRHAYIHAPFCARRCSYCDFAIAVRARVPVDEYLDALRRELELRYPVGSAEAVDTLYFGGGTPSRLGPSGVAAMAELVQRHLPLADGAEVTLEANPEDATAEAVAAWRVAGVNRLSLGAQSFDDQVLRWMHRVHDAARTLEAVRVIREAAIDNFSIDLIFALPPQVQRSWRHDLEQAVRLEPAHISLYGLTVESATPLWRWRDRGEIAEASEERYESEFLGAAELLACEGYEHYEVSNFARPGYRSRHNSSYWGGVPYAGVGPGAHEFDGVRRRWNVGAYVEWCRRLQLGLDPVEGDETLSGDNRATEEVYLGLRTTSGLRLAASEVARARRWEGSGWGAVQGDRLRLTALGWLRLDALAADLTAFRSRY
jgi:putative oxygen-independent coproporphyrinogen III oxidase